MDLASPDAVNWARGLMSTYLARFGGSTWHTGGDEYPEYNQRLNDTGNLGSLTRAAVSQFGAGATAEDLYRAFMNGNDAIARQHGKSMRMWGDDLFPSSKVPLNSDITVTDWLAMPGGLSPADLAANGNQVINGDNTFLYYDEGSTSLPNTSGQRIWEQFDPGVFNGNRTLPGGRTDPHLAGVLLCEWDAQAEDPGRLERDLAPLNRALAQKSWGTTPLFATWNQMQPTLNLVGQAPGFLATPAPGDPGAGSVAGSRTEVFGTSQNAFVIHPDGSLTHSWWAPGMSATESEQLAPAGSAAGQPVAYVTAHQQHVM
ncbi:family 20 glycosylhydrolase [Fodinicola feengrottensis]|uniref:family 20 glycosylhydrolase n=1 Tax=Fodinicola feengrottensis TaxID=435914 RepID=UPI002442F98A|nr:family 20 glycosylhydrolase [Fodinicola feengrottensis]